MRLKNTGPYLLLMVDPDWNKTTPPSVVLHTIVANLTTSLNNTGEGKAIATYISPQPSSGTHNYTLFLFNQPSNFNIPARYATFMETNAETPLNRLNLPLESFINQTSLGAPIAANYFRVTAVAASNSTSSGAAASSTSSAAAIKIAASGNYYLAGALALVGAAVATI